MKEVVGGERFEQPELVKISYPTIADGFGNGMRQGRIRKQQPAPLRYSVGLIVETLRKQVGQIFDGIGAQESGVNRGYAVGAVRADNRQVRHTNLPLASLFDQTDSLNPFIISGKSLPNVIQQTSIDFVDDFK